MTTVTVNAMDVFDTLTSRREKSNTLKANKIDPNEWEPMDWVKGMVVPLTGPLTAADVWIVWFTYHLRYNGLAPDLDEFFEDYKALEFLEPIIADIDAFLEEHDDNWIEFFRDYIIPFGKNRRRVAETIVTWWYQCNAKFHNILNYMQEKSRSFISEYGYARTAIGHPYFDLFDEYFIGLHCENPERLQGMSPYQRVHDFLGRNKHYVGLYEAMTLTVRGHITAANSADVWSMVYALPKEVWIISDDPFFVKPKPEARHIQKLVFDKKTHKVKVIGEPNPKNESGEANNQEETATPVPPALDEKPDPHNCQHEYHQMSEHGYVWLACEHCDDVTPLVN